MLDGFAILNSSFQMKLNLWDAEVAGSADDIDVADGSISWRVFANAMYTQADVVAVELSYATGSPSTTPTWQFQPAVASLPWAQRACKGRTGSQQLPNPVRVKCVGEREKRGAQ